MKALGFAGIKNNGCPCCHKPVANNPKNFRDAESYEEYQLSGLCQHCQDDTFKGEE